jgi:hypothetical protein
MLGNVDPSFGGVGAFFPENLPVVLVKAARSTTNVFDTESSVPQLHTIRAAR